MVIGNTYSTWLNGEPIMRDYVSDTIISQPGTIGLQVHGNREMSIYFRNIQVAEL